MPACSKQPEDEVVVVSFSSRGWLAGGRKTLNSPLAVFVSSDAINLAAGAILPPIEARKTKRAMGLRRM